MRAAAAGVAAEAIGAAAAAAWSRSNRRCRRRRSTDAPRPRGARTSGRTASNLARPASSRLLSRTAICGSPTSTGRRRGHHTDGSEKARIKYGTGSWVYGEELEPDDRDLVVAREHASRLLPLRRKPGEGFLPADEPDGDAGHARRRGVPQSRRAQSDRRRLRLRVAARKTTKIDIRNGKPFDNDVVGHYVYDVRWSPDGTELLMNRTNRRQQIMEFVGVQPGDAARAASSFTRNGRPGGPTTGPPCTWLKDRQALHLGIGAQRLAQLLPLRSQRQATQSDHALRPSSPAPSSRSTRRQRVMFYMARDGDNYMKMQLHRVGLDGTGDVRLTDPTLQPHRRLLCEAGGGGRRGGGGDPAARRRDLRHLVGQPVHRRRLSDA